MSDLRDTLADIVNERETFTGEFCKNLVDGSRFTGEFEDGQPIELREAMGRDKRESAILHVTDDAAAEKLIDQQKIQVLLYGAWNNFKIIGRTRNGGSPQVDFSLMILTEKDAQ